jgi:hypothetical protein
MVLSVCVAVAITLGMVYLTIVRGAKSVPELRREVYQERWPLYNAARMAYRKARTSFANAVTRIPQAATFCPEAGRLLPLLTRGDELAEASRRAVEGLELRAQDITMGDKDYQDLAAAVTANCVQPLAETAAKLWEWYVPEHPERQFSEGENLTEGEGA